MNDVEFDAIVVGAGINGMTAAAGNSRRTPATARHRTVVPGLWHIGASTHPGPGLGGGSGYLVATELTHPGWTAALLARPTNPDEEPLRWPPPASTPPTRSSS